MRWVPLIIIAYLFALLQATLGKILTLDRLPIGPVGPDLLVLLAVFVALNVRSLADGMIAGWIIGFVIDLTTGGAAGDITRIGPMAIAYALCVWMVFAMREAMFRDRPGPQIILAGLFCLLGHGLWASVQALLASGATWASFGGLMLQVLLSAIYTALLMPLMNFLLTPCRGVIISTPLEHHRRGRRR
jgi:rod shape-determining protein MreD